VRTLGIIGGLGPESTIDYYQTIIALYQERTGDGSYPQFLINSVDLNKVREFVIANDLQRLTGTIVEEIEKLARAGADFGLIAANTPHLTFDQIAERSSIPLISIVEATCAAAKVRKLKKLVLFGTKFTMTGEFFPKVFSREGIARDCRSNENEGRHRRRDPRWDRAALDPARTRPPRCSVS